MKSVKGYSSIRVLLALVMVVASLLVTLPLLFVIFVYIEGLIISKDTSDIRVDVLLHHYAHASKDDVELITQDLNKDELSYYFKAKLESKGLTSYVLSMDLIGETTVRLEGRGPVYFDYSYIEAQEGDFIYGTTKLSDIACTRHKEGVCVNITVSADHMDIKKVIRSKDVESTLSANSIINYLNINDSKSHYQHIKNSFADDIFTAEGTFLFKKDSLYTIAIDAHDDKKQCLVVAPFYRHTFFAADFKKGDRVSVSFYYDGTAERLNTSPYDDDIFMYFMKNSGLSFEPLDSIDDIYLNGTSCITGVGGFIEKIN